MDDAVFTAAIMICVAIGFILYQHFIIRQREGVIDHMMHAMHGIVDGEVEVYRDERGRVRFKLITK